MFRYSTSELICCIEIQLACTDWAMHAGITMVVTGMMGNQSAAVLCGLKRKQSAVFISRRCTLEG